MSNKYTFKIGFNGALYTLFNIAFLGFSNV